MRALAVTICDLTWAACWLGLYICIAYLGVKNRSCGMPFICIAMNIAFEFLYAIDGSMRPMTIATAVYWAWAIVDVVILYTYIRYGSKDFPDKYRQYKPLWIVGVLVSAACVQAGFYLQFPPQEAAQYASFMGVVVISVWLFWWYVSEKNMDAQSIWIAALKLIGDIAVTAEIGGGIWQLDYLVLAFGSVACVFDAVYLYLFIRDRRY